MAKPADRLRDPYEMVELAMRNSAEEYAALFDECERCLALALEYWAHRQQRYKNRHPAWVKNARALLAKLRGEQ